MKTLDYIPYKNDHKEGAGGKMIAIKKIYSQDEIKMPDNQESEIKVEDNTWVIKWIEST